MPDPPSPRPKRVATPSWLDLRLVLGVLLVIASVLIGAKIVAGAKNTSATVTTSRDLAAGTVLTRADLRVAQARLPDDRSDAYLSSVDDAVGKRLTRDVSRGELLPAGSIAAAAAQTTLTVPLAAGAAPTLKTGQRIELFVSSASCPSVVLLPEVVVQSVRADDENSFGAGSGGQNVVISVDRARAGRVVAALAIDGVTVRAGVLTGAGSAPGSPSPTVSGSASGSASGAAQDGDLTACGSSDAPR
jgi:hypothetical protein